MPGPRPPIFQVPTERRLFTTPSGATGDCLLLHEVQCFSFYNFVPVPDPKRTAEAFKTQLAAEGIQPYEQFTGTMYLAPEGINGQFSVRLDAMESFEQLLRTTTAALVDKATIDLNMGEVLLPGNSAPFKRFHVVSRPQILTDGLLHSVSSAEQAPSFDWGDAGPELSPREWHQQLLAAQSAIRDPASAGPAPVVLDCRNSYESDAGTFEGASALGTTKFAESWEALDTAVKGLPKDTPVYTFCTGGIRCVKVNAYLKQQHGLQSLNRLQHGIIGYERWMKGQGAADEQVAAASGDPSAQSTSLFKGENFIFDLRKAPAAAPAAADERATKRNKTGEVNASQSTKPESC